MLRFRTLCSSLTSRLKDEGSDAFANGVFHEETMVFTRVYGMACDIDGTFAVMAAGLDWK